MTRRKKAREEAEINCWPSTFPDDVGSVADASGELSLDCEELGSHFLSDVVEPTHGVDPRWLAEIDEEPAFDAQMGRALLRSFGLKPMPKRATTRPLATSAAPLPKLAPPRLPRDWELYMTPDDELDLTEETIRDVSMMDHESEEEAGEVESPYVRTEDVHTHGKRRGGHARTSLRPKPK